MRMALIVSFLLGGLVAIVVSPARLRAERPQTCDKWQTAVGIDLPTGPEKLSEIPAYGTVRPRAAPEGWEPFAVAPSGQIAFRRCTP